jgi:hypothetical protein
LTGPLTRTSPGSAKADGAVGSRAHGAASDTNTMLPFEQKASPFCAPRDSFIRAHRVQRTIFERRLEAVWMEVVAGARNWLNLLLVAWVAPWVQSRA